MATAKATTIEALVAAADERRRLLSAESFADDLGGFGESVGPRTGLEKRQQKDKENYVLRRLLAALKIAGRLDFPLEFWHGDPKRDEPDFVLSDRHGIVGAEVTEAGSEVYQAWLTALEKKPEPELYPDTIATPRTAEEIAKAIARKVEKLAEGRYRAVVTCDLAVYDNTAWGGFLDKREILHALGRPNELIGRFRKVHLVFETFVILDVWGADPTVVDVANAYEIDFAAWALDQAGKLRAGRIDGLDVVNLAEELESLGRSERRALASHIRNLLMHLLKWQFQSSRRSASWENTIAVARSEVGQALTEMPSLRRDLPDVVAQEYPRAVRVAATETKLAMTRFPQSCPYGLEQLIDPEYLPEAQP